MICELSSVRCTCGTVIGSIHEELRTRGLPNVKYPNQDYHLNVLKAFGYKPGEKMDLSYYRLLTNLIKEDYNPEIFFDVLRYPEFYVSPAILNDPVVLRSFGQEEKEALYKEEHKEEIELERQRLEEEEIQQQLEDERYEEAQRRKDEEYEQDPSLREWDEDELEFQKDTETVDDYVIPGSQLVPIIQPKPEVAGLTPSQLERVRYPRKQINIFMRDRPIDFITPRQDELLNDLYDFEDYVSHFNPNVPYDPDRAVERLELTEAQQDRIKKYILENYLDYNEFPELKNKLERILRLFETNKTDDDYFKMYEENEELQEYVKSTFTNETVFEDQVNHILSVIKGKYRYDTLALMNSVERNILTNLESGEYTLKSKETSDPSQFNYVLGNTLDADQLKYVKWRLRMEIPKTQIGYERIIAEGYKPNTPLNEYYLANYLGVQRLCCRSTLMNRIMLPYGPPTAAEANLVKAGKEEQTIDIIMADQRLRILTQRTATMGNPIAILEPLVEAMTLYKNKGKKGSSLMSTYKPIIRSYDAI